MTNPRTGLRTPTSTTVVQTPNVARIRAIMDEALKLSDPLEFRFTVERHGTVEIAKSRATSLQNQFNSIRARARNAYHAQIGRKAVEYNSEQIKGPYDDLACNKQPLPNGEGYLVLIGRAPQDEFEIYNARTGERVLNEDPREKRAMELVGFWSAKMFSGAPKPWLTYEQERELYDLNPVMFRNLFEASKVPLPAWVNGLDALTSNGPALDILDTPIDEFGV